MERWEYLTKFITADMNSEEARMQLAALETGARPKYAPEAMIPELNRLGEKGWELIYMQPVFIGHNHDILMHEGGGMKRWTNQYFCVFKRRT
jgi:hypothetical protein